MAYSLLNLVKITSNLIVLTCTISDRFHFVNLSLLHTRIAKLALTMVTISHHINLLINHHAAIPKGELHLPINTIQNRWTPACGQTGRKSIRSSTLQGGLLSTGREGRQALRLIHSKPELKTITVVRLIDLIMKLYEISINIYQNVAF